MSPNPNPTATLEALLQNACRRAMRIGLSFTSQIRLYRSIIALAAEVRLRTAPLRRDIGNHALAALLSAVCDQAAECGLDPELPLPDAILMQRLVVQLSRASRRAGGIEPATHRFVEQNPMHRENPPYPAHAEQNPMHPEDPREPAFSNQNPMHPEKPPEPMISEQNPIHRDNPIEPATPNARISQKNPIHRENALPDDHLSVWRTDHTAERDQRAHELLRTVIDDRLLNPIRAMNKREREEQAAVA